VKKLVDWVVGFKRLAKTADGFAVEALAPTVAPTVASEKHDNAIVTAPTEVLPKTGISEPDDDNWAIALFAKRYTDAVRLLEQVIASSQAPSERLVSQSALGYVKYEQNVTAGMQYFEALLRQYPTEDEPYHWYGLSYLWHHLYDKALAVAERGIASAETKWRLWDLKSDCLAELGRIDEAIAAAEAGVAAAPSEPANYLNLIRLNEKRVDVAAVRRWIRRALDATHNNQQVLSESARFLADNDAAAEAAVLYVELVERYPKNATYLTLLGNSYFTLGYHDHALSLYHQANDLAGGTQGWILANIGNLLNNRGLHGDAITFLKRAIEQEPDSDYAHDRLAQAQKLTKEESGKILEALRDARRTLSQSDAT
jgi:tetratricopeptide (TPR) repeat protein